MGIMRKSQLNKAKQDRLIEHFVAGATARCAADLVRVNLKKAIYFFHKLQEIIAYHLEQEADTVFSGEIEVDESYFGGKRKGKTWSRCSRESPGIWPFEAWGKGLYENYSGYFVSNLIPHYLTQS